MPETCEHCGGKLVEYKHHLNRALVTGLAALARAGGGPMNIRELGLNRNVWDNFQKLRYFDLVDQCFDVDGLRQRGVWQVTDHGWAFLAREVASWSQVWTFRGDRVRWAGHQVHVDDVHEGYQEFAVWVAERRPHRHDVEALALF